jgi:hypothetical protein
MTDPTTENPSASASPEMTLGEWADWMNESLYVFTSKPINSNAVPIGVRPALGLSHGLPYLSASRLLDQGTPVDLDYLSNTNGNSSLFAQLRGGLGELVSQGSPKKPKRSSAKKKTKKNEEPERPKKPPLEPSPEIQAAYWQAAATPREQGTDVLCPRMRQLKLPTPDGSYLVISPLASAGLARLVRGATMAWDQRVDDKQVDGQFTSYAIQPIGGKNPQNVGGRVQNLQRVLVLDRLPRNSSLERQAFGLRHRGFSPRLSRGALSTLISWWDKRKGPLRADAKPFGLLDKQVEASHLKQLVGLLHHQARCAKELLEQHQAVLFGSQRAEDVLLDEWSPLELGWVFPSLREADWRRAARTQVLGLLTTTAIAHGEEGQPLFIDFDESDIQRLRTRLKEVL